MAHSLRGGVRRDRCGLHDVNGDETGFLAAEVRLDGADMAGDQKNTAGGMGQKMAKRRLGNTLHFVRWSLQCTVVCKIAAHGHGPKVNRGKKSIFNFQ